jgi:hypothetical protein
MSVRVAQVIISAFWRVVKEVKMGVLGSCKFGGRESIVPATFWLEKFGTKNSVMISVKLAGIGFEHSVNLVGYRMTKRGTRFRYSVAVKERLAMSLRCFGHRRLRIAIVWMNFYCGDEGGGGHWLLGTADWWIWNDFESDTLCLSEVLAALLTEMDCLLYSLFQRPFKVFLFLSLTQWWGAKRGKCV